MIPLSTIWLNTSFAFVSFVSAEGLPVISNLQYKKSNKKQHLLQYG
jgi:hypothetical protein